MGEFLMPSLGADMDSGRLLEWLVTPGDTVHRGDIVAVVDTAKSAIEVEVFEDGTVAELLVEPGAEVPVGTPLATIDRLPGPASARDAGAAAGEPDDGGASAGPDAGTTAAGSDDGAVAAERPVAEVGEPRALPAESDIAEPSVARLARLASPPVRHLAAQRGVSLEGIEPTGRGGRITRDDVEAAARAQEGAGRHPAKSPRPSGPPDDLRKAAGRRISPRARRLAAERGVDLDSVPGTTISGDDIPKRPVEPAQPSPTHTEPTDRRERMRQATAALMARAAREIPHYYVSRTVDVQPLVRWLADHNADLPVRQRVLPVAAMLRATVVACIEVPELNGRWVDDGFVAGDGVHLGVATATRGGGLVTPTLRDAEADDVDALMARLSDVVRRAKQQTLRSSEMAPGTITVSSLADGGPDALYGVIYPPQVALVGIGSIAERPWAVAGMLTVRPTVTITLAADHRATDGRTGAAFLRALTDALEHPEAL